MATAPTPGVSTRTNATEAAQALITLTIDRPLTTGKGRPIANTHTIAINNIPMKERFICRKATGFPISAFWSEDHIDIDSLVVLWWMARRLNGEASLTIAQAEEEWPFDLDFESELHVEFDDGDSDTGDDEDPNG